MSPATATPRWATPPASSRPCCPPMRARRTWRWATRRWSTRAPSSCSATTTSCCASSRPRSDFEAIKDYVAWTMHAAQAIAVKVVNPGGISAFKFNQRKLDLDEKHVYYGVTPRADHPDAGARRCRSSASRIRCTSMAAISAFPATSRRRSPPSAPPKACRMHLTHIQFHSYGTEGDAQFSSGARADRRAGQQVRRTSRSTSARSCSARPARRPATACASTPSRKSANPKKWVVMDIECDAGCGVVPIRYRDKSFVNALQWAIGLETFLLVDDPWRIFLTTDHPNGAPFYYLSASDPAADGPGLPRRHAAEDQSRRRASQRRCRSLDREYSLDEIAIMTRAGPARSLGLQGSRPSRRRRRRRHHRLPRRCRPRGDVRDAGVRVQERRAGRARRQGGQGRAAARRTSRGPTTTAASRSR